MNGSTGFLVGMTFGTLLLTGSLARVRGSIKELVRAGTLRYEPRAGEPASADELIRVLGLAGQSRGRTILIWTTIILAFLGVWLGLTFGAR